MKKGSYRTKDDKAQIDWELEDKENGPEFSATGEFDGGMGQCIDKIAAAYPHDEMVQRIAAVWREWHLNGMTAGTPEQEIALRIWKAAGNRYEYGAAVEHLKKVGLHEVEIDPKQTEIRATGGFEEIYHPVTHNLIYRYGTRWLHRPIPAAILAEIESWNAKAPPPAESLHEAQAKQFLETHGLKLRIALSDSKPAQWQPAGHHYRVTLSRSHRPIEQRAVAGYPVGVMLDKSTRLTFDFWGSVNDADKGKDPTPYDVLACVSSDIYTPETFEEFCSEFGYDPDSIKAKQTWNRAHRFAQRLRAFFTSAETEQLQEIR